MKADCRKLPVELTDREEVHTNCTMNHHIYHWDLLGKEVLICTGACDVGCRGVIGVILGRG